MLVSTKKYQKNRKWYEDVDDIDESETFSTYCAQYDNLSNDKAVPAFDLSNSEHIVAWAQNKGKRLAIRIRNNEFGLIDSELNDLFTNGTLDRGSTDIILDLRSVDADNLFSKSSVLKATFSDLDKPSNFNSIIIASGSFTKSSQSLEPKRIYVFPRNEVEIHMLALKLSEKFGFNYIYSDYGPSDLEDVVFVVGMVPNFKIKYTSFDQYLYIKGISIKKGGLDLHNVVELCNLLVESEHYTGEIYSWGDKNIYDLAKAKSSSPGNLTKWVGYSLNHHMVFILNQV